MKKKLIQLAMLTALPVFGQLAQFDKIYGDAMIETNGVSKATTITINGDTQALSNDVSFTVTADNSFATNSTYAVTVTGSQSNDIASCVIHTNRTDNPHSTTLAEAYIAGDFAGTEVIGPLRVNAYLFDPFAPIATTGTGNMSFGSTVHNGTTGDFNFGYGIEVFKSVTGDENYGAGRSVFENVSGNGNVGIGKNRVFYNVIGAENCYGIGDGTFYFSTGGATNCMGIGINNGRSASGEFRMWLDVSQNPNLEFDDNAIYIDDGQLNLGRTGSLTNSAPNELRGRWDAIGDLSVQGGASFYGGLAVNTNECGAGDIACFHYFESGPSRIAIKNHTANGGSPSTAQVVTRNDLDYEFSMGILGSASSFGSFGVNSGAMYHSGYGEWNFILDGDEEYKWWINEGDAHDFNVTEIVSLDKNGLDMKTNTIENLADSIEARDAMPRYEVFTAITNLVSELGQAGSVYYMAGNTASDVSGYRLLTPIYDEADGLEYNETSVGFTNNQYVGNYVTEAGGFVADLQAGELTTHAHITLTDGGGPSTIYVKAEVYRLNQDGSVDAEIDSVPAQLIADGGTSISYTWNKATASIIDFEDKRLAIRFKVVDSSISGTDTISIDTEGDTLARFVSPINVSDIQAANIQYDNTNSILTANNVQDAIDEVVSADFTPYAITAVNGTATVSRANGWLQSIDMSGNLVLDVGAASSTVGSQINLSINAGANTLSYSDNATNIVTGLSDITVTNVTTILFYSPMFTNTWEATEL